MTYKWSWFTGGGYVISLLILGIILIGITNKGSDMVSRYQEQIQEINYQLHIVRNLQNRKSLELVWLQKSISSKKLHLRVSSYTKRCVVSMSGNKKEMVKAILKGSYLGVNTASFVIQKQGGIYRSRWVINEG